MAVPLPGTRCPDFLHGNPTVRGDILVRTFVAGDGVVFRVTDSKTGTWGFYNDSTNAVAIIGFVLGMGSRVQPLAGMDIRRDPETLMYYGSVRVLPLASEPVFRGYVDSYKFTYSFTDMNFLITPEGSPNGSGHRRSYEYGCGGPNLYSSVRSITLPSLASPRALLKQRQDLFLIVASKMKSRRSNDSLASHSLHNMRSKSSDEGSASPSSSGQKPRLSFDFPASPVKGHVVASQPNFEDSMSSRSEAAQKSNYQRAASPRNKCIKTISNEDSLPGQVPKRVTF